MLPTIPQQINCVKARLDDIEAYCQTNQTQEYPVTFCSFSYDELLAMYSELQATYSTTLEEYDSWVR